MFEPFTCRARAKINLALHVLARRADGYHQLDSIVAFADAGDDLRFAPAPRFCISAEGPFAAALPHEADNIITRAWALATELAGQRGRVLPPVAVHLVKNLPVASGIGGGSADAAAALRGFLEIAGVGEIDSGVMTAALALGADVPVCLAGRSCRMRGIGEQIAPLDRFDPVHALLVNPGVAVSTSAVFGQLGLARGQSHGSPIADPADPGGWRNDLESPAIQLAPVIADVLAMLRAMPGVTRCFMSGSGATCVALCEHPLQPPPVPPGWWTVRTVLR